MLRFESHPIMKKATGSGLPALRGSFRLRLASTFNHRPAEARHDVSAKQGSGDARQGFLQLTENGDRPRVDPCERRNPKRHVIADQDQIEQLCEIALALR